MVQLGTYAFASVAASLAAVYHAFHTREQFYPAMVYLSTSKVSVVLLLNMAFVLTYSAWQFLKLMFLGSLREAEVERLNEQLWRELMEVLFAMTIFREEFNVSFVALVTVLLFVKAFHWLAQKRVEYIEITPAVSRLSHVRIVAFMIFLLAMDLVFVRSSLGHLLKTRRPSVSLFFAFEYLILATSVVSMLLKYSLYMGDMWMEGQWDNKAVYIFYLELFRDLLHLSLYLIFFLVIFVYYGLPLHLVRELYEIVRNFKSRVSDFMRYRKVTSNMNERFPDATQEELERSDATCIICREEMTVAKKLPCGHLFHVHCLRSWLERQQTCPTCRSPVIAENGADQRPQQQQQQLNQQEQQQGSPEGQAPNPESNVEGPVNPQQARVQAALSAAAQYNSSAYPTTIPSTMDWHPIYLPIQIQTQNSADSSTSTSSASLQSQRAELQRRLANGEVYLMPVVPTVAASAPAANGSPPQQQEQQTDSQQAQYRHLQGTIQLLQQQLNAALEMQKRYEAAFGKGKAPLSSSEEASSSTSATSEISSS